MGVFDFLKQDRTAETAVQERTEQCPHRVLLPRWDDVADMGDESKISAYACDACGALLSREEAAQRESAISL